MMLTFVVVDSKAVISNATSFYSFVSVISLQNVGVTWLKKLVPSSASKSNVFHRFQCYNVEKRERYG